MDQSRIVFAAQQLLFSEGDFPDCAYLIDSGQVQVFQWRGTERIELALLGVGDLLGEMAMIDAAPRTASAIALTEVTVTSIGQTEINERLQRCDPVVRALLQSQTLRLREMLQGKHTELNADSAQAPHPYAAVNDKLRLEASLKNALVEGELEVLYQPILDLRLNEIAGFEALVRWHHSELGVVAPSTFIALAEETSLIVPVGWHVLEHACNLLQKINDSERQNDIFIAINISAEQLGLKDFAEQLNAKLLNSATSNRQIKIEVTESCLANVDSLDTLMQSLQKLGIRVALDDFGTGYSNLAYLPKLHFDSIKLDQSFTLKMLDDPRSLVVVKAIITMASELGANVVAEGVETIEQRNQLMALNCRYGQGYLFGKPMSAEHVMKLLSAT